MPWIFRALNSKSRWNKQKHQEAEEYSWLQENEIPAETLTEVVGRDIRNNELSVYLVEDDPNKIERLIAAYAANRDNLQNLDYKLVDYDKMLSQDFVFKETRADVPDETVGQWHRDLHQLTVSQLVAFTTLLYRDAESKRVQKKKVGKLIADSIQAGYIDKDKIRSEKMRIQIMKLM